MADARQKNPSDVLQSYRRWKEEGAALKAQAQNLLVERFHELVQEAQQVQHDLYDDFGHTVKFPVNPKFAKKGKTRPAGKKTVTPARVAASEPLAHAPSTKASVVQKASGGGASLRVSATETRPRATAAPKRATPASAASSAREVERLSRQVEKARQRLAEAKELGGPVKIQNAEDRLYELSDELRLLTSQAD